MVKDMSKEEILQTFSDINYAYNNSTKYDTLKRMLDELNLTDTVNQVDINDVILTIKAYNMFENTMNQYRPKIVKDTVNDVLIEVIDRIRQEYE